MDSLKPFRRESGHAIYFCFEIVVDENTQNTYTENLARSVDKDTAFNTVDMLFWRQKICRYCS